MVNRKITKRQWEDERGCNFIDTPVKLVMITETKKPWSNANDGLRLKNRIRLLLKVGHTNQLEGMDLQTLTKLKLIALTQQLQTSGRLLKEEFVDRTSYSERLNDGLNNSKH